MSPNITPSITMISEGKKFMWDGLSYDTKEDASRAGQLYQDDGFQIRIVEEGGKFLVYTRRLAKEVAVTAQ